LSTSPLQSYYVALMVWKACMQKVLGNVYLLMINYLSLKLWRPLTTDRMCHPLLSPQELNGKCIATQNHGNSI
jgi:hypothetical protein